MPESHSLHFHIFGRPLFDNEAIQRFLFGRGLRPLSNLLIEKNTSAFPPIKILLFHRSKGVKILQSCGNISFKKLSAFFGTLLPSGGEKVFLEL